MSYEIIGETIKSATSIKLGQIFDNPYRYKENVTNPKYPCFNIIQVNLSVTPQQSYGTSILDNPLKRIQLDYLMNIQYRVAENTETVTNLQQQLDEIGLKLLAEFTELNLEKPTKVKNAYYEKVDGVLQFFYNITVFAIPEIEEENKMETLDINKNIEE